MSSTESFNLWCTRQTRIQGRWNGWIFTPPFSEPPSFFFFLSLKYWNNIWFLWFLWLRWRMCISDDWLYQSIYPFWAHKLTVECLYTKVLRLSELVGSAEERPRVNRRGTAPAETAKEYWKRTVAIPFLDIVSSELKSPYSHEKWAHYELCALVPEAISKKDENAVTSLLNVLKEKWEHILPLPAAFESELFRWSNHWKRQEAMPDESVASIIASHADGIFFPNIRELLKILAVLPIGSTEAERSFSCLRRLHTWLRSTMTTDRLSDLSVIAMHGNTMVALETDSICRAFMELHPRRMTEPSLFGQ